MLPQVSVVIPVYNNELFVREAIESALGQAGPGLEVIVVDDGSTDASAERAAEIPDVRVIRQANGGIGAARNAGVALATGEFIGFLDADDVWTVDRLLKLLAVVDDFDAVFGQAVQFGKHRDETEPQAALLAGTMLIRRASFERVGPFDEGLRVGEFIDWWARAEELGLKWTQIPEVVLRRRIHTTNTGITHAGDRVDYTRVLRAALERRRAMQ